MIFKLTLLILTICCAYIFVCMYTCIFLRTIQNIYTVIRVLKEYISDFLNFWFFFQISIITLNIIFLKRIFIA